MSQHSALFDAAATPQLAAQFGDEDVLSYQDADPEAAAVVVTAIVGPEQTERRRDRNGALELVRVRSVFLQDSVVDRAVVKTNGSVTIGGRTYAITHVGEVVGELYEVSLEAVAKAEITREGYRR